MRSSYANADANKDSVVTLEEMTKHLGNFGSGNSGPSASSTASTNSRGGGRDWRGGGRDGGRDGGRGDREERGGSRDGERTTSRASYRFLSADERVSSLLPGSLRDSFLRLDDDNDGQVSMSEFERTWTDEKVREFQQLDANNDGVVTPHEYLASDRG